MSLLGQDYIKDIKIIEKSDNEKKRELVLSIIKAKSELERASKNFELAPEGLIDYYSYQIKAHQAKMDYLVKLAKSNNIKIDLMKNIELKASM